MLHVAPPLKKSHSITPSCNVYFTVIAQLPSFAFCIENKMFNMCFLNQQYKLGQFHFNIF